MGIDEHMGGKAQLFQIVLAMGPARCLSGGLYRRQEQRHENAYDGNHHQQLNEGKAK
jgi:hypothetical protein